MFYGGSEGESLPLATVGKPSSATPSAGQPRNAPRGFDIVIGNPPYIGEGDNSGAFIGFKETSPYYMGKMNLWFGFACHGIDMLREKGNLCFIATNNWTTAAGGKKLRNLITEKAKIIQMLDFNEYMIFETASIQTMIMQFEKDSVTDNYTFDYRKLTKSNAQKENMKNLLEKKERAANYLRPKFKRENFKNKNYNFSSNVVEGVLDKMSNMAEYLDNKEATNGIHPHFDFIAKKHTALFPNVRLGAGIFGLSNEELKTLNLTNKEKKLIKPYYTTDQIHRYYTDQKNILWLIYTDSSYKDKKSMNHYPNLKKHLDFYKNVISSDNKPYGLHRAREERFFNGEKVVVLRKCVGQPSFSYSDFACYVSATFYVIKTDRFNMKFLTGFLNSSSVKFWLKHRGKMQGENFQIDKEPLMGIPIPTASSDLQEPIIDLVDKIIAAKKTNPSTDTTALQQQIDQLVYKLYDLTENEIQIVENSNK